MRVSYLHMYPLLLLKLLELVHENSLGRHCRCCYVANDVVGKGSGMVSKLPGALGVY